MPDRKFGKETEKSLQIYFGRSLSAGRDFEDHTNKLAEEIDRLGHEITSKHVVSWDLQLKFRERAKESGNYSQYISKHNKDMMHKSDAGFFDISQPSLGVGFEICYMVYVLNKPAAVLFYKNSATSSTVLGDNSKLINHWC